MFQSARIKLTTWYLMIIMFVSIAFSVVIYRLLIQEVERFARFQRFRIEQQIHPTGNGQVTIQPIEPLPNQDKELIDDAKNRLILSLIIINSFILIGSGILGYLLAGKTLEPIQLMHDEQNRFISDASHELRTPLTAIKSSIEVSLREKNPTSTDLKQVLSDNLEDVKRLERLTNQLLQLVQLQKQPAETIKKNSALYPLIQQAKKQVEAKAHAKELTITVSGQKGSINGNPDELIQLFTILLDNAVKYSPVHATITIMLRTTRTGVEILVEDEGIGIKKKDLPYIFDRFYRADTARSKKDSSGYGLGLSIAKHIVLSHDGIISCRSAIGKGTTFIIEFPKA